MFKGKRTRHLPQCVILSTAEDTMSADVAQTYPQVNGINGLTFGHPPPPALAR